MQILKISLLSLCISTGAYAKNSQTTLQIIMDDSGVLLHAKEADKYKLGLLSHIKHLIRKHEYSNAHIDVISTSIGRTIWSGLPSDLKRKPERALALVESIKTDLKNCNNLPSAFMELASNLKALKRQGFTKSHVIIFSSLIHTPRPCDTTSQVILPQVPPVEGNINASLTSSKTVSSINFYWVAPHQMRVWGDFLEPTFNWALKKNIPMTFMDIERSKFSLQQGLKLEKGK